MTGERNESRVVVCEGFGDTEPGWDFTMPVWMVKPAQRLRDDAGSIFYAENVVEDYLLDVSLGDSGSNHEMVEYEKRLWRKARRGEGKAGRLVYWKCEVTLPEGDPPDYDEDPDAHDAWWEVVVVGNIEYIPAGSRSGGRER